MLLEPTATMAVFPEACACGHPGFADLMPYDTHQAIELPVIRPEVTHWIIRHESLPTCSTP